MTRYPPFLLPLALLLPLAGCPGDDGAGDSNTTDGGTAETSADTNTDPTEGPDGMFCAHQCSADADCLVGGMDIGLTCQGSFCSGDAPDGCTDNAECIAQFSGWMTPCTSGGGECDALSQLCVQGPDGGLCATPPSDFFMCDSVPGFSEIEVPDIDGTTVTVCGNANAQCGADAVCFSPCQSDADCSSAAYPVCDVGTGTCGCSADTDCATLGIPHLSVCSDGLCGCGEDQQCVDGDAGDVCNPSGLCGCSGDAACANVTNSFDGGMISCVGN
ncbi:Endo-1,4-beta-xylanase A precursor [Enhygromyxa salina]|uniref:Endo-1,4-beta-xylanase A n=1 Tax=Enhygromyxa salina TaxID=215803 RepID=A0A0C1ZNJ6_9BACT|nr:hypothetical protein [Enhygromyxa salina]KIG12648.1 Endo-1,4-beta-xylanase A precursor [Enhygromyxa salina]